MQEFIEFAARALSVDAGALGPESGYESVPGWDSLAHMRLVMAVEDEYGIEVPIDDLSGLTLGTLYEMIGA